MDKGICLVAGTEEMVGGSGRGDDDGSGTRVEHLQADGGGTKLGCFGVGGSNTEQAGVVSSGDDRAELGW